MRGVVGINHSHALVLRVIGAAGRVVAPGHGARRLGGREVLHGQVGRRDGVAWEREWRAETGVSLIECGESQVCRGSPARARPQRRAVIRAAVERWLSSGRRFTWD